MIKDVTEAIKLIKSDPEISKYDIIKAYDCNYANRHYYAFRVCKPGFPDCPGLTSFLVSVFDSEKIISGDRIFEPPGGKEIPIPKV